MGRNNGIAGITSQIKEISGLSTQVQNTFGWNVTDGYDQQKNTARHQKIVSTDDLMSERNRTRFLQEKEKQFALAGGDMDSRFNPVYTNDVYGEVERKRAKNERDTDRFREEGEGRRGRHGYNEQPYPEYRFRGSQQDQRIATYYNDQYRNGGNNYAYNNPPAQYNRPAQYNTIDGMLTAQETRKGLDCAGLTRNPAYLLDFASDLQAVTGRNLTYDKNGQPMLSMRETASALNEYLSRPEVRGKINIQALEAGDPHAWQALDAFLDSDMRRMAPRGNTPGQDQNIDPRLQTQITPPAPTKTCPPDEKISQRIGELIAEELAAIKDPKERAAKAQEISNQIAAGLQAKGYKVQGNPIDELSGYIAAEKPKYAELLRNGTKEEAAKALRQATGELDSEATRALTIAKINASQTPMQNTSPHNGQVNNQSPNTNTPNQGQGANNVVSNAAQEEKLLVASLERGQSVDRISDIKNHLNKITGSKFKGDDNVNEAGFIPALNQALKQNLDNPTYRDMLTGGAFTAKGTLELIEKNMGNRADVEQNRKRFDEGFKDGAAKQIINATLNESGQDGHIKLQQDLRKIGYDSQRGLEGSLKEYLGDKLYNQGNFRTAPESVRNFIKDVEAGNYKEGFPLTNPSNAAQMREVVDYVQDSVNLDLEKQKRGLPVGKAANVATPVNEQQKPNVVVPTQSAVTAQTPNQNKTPVSGDGGAVVDDSVYGKVRASGLNIFMQNESERGMQNGKISNLATATRYNRVDEIINNSKYTDTYNNNQPEIKAEIKRQNERNEVALQNLEAQRKTTQTSDVNVPEQKSEISNNPPKIVLPPLTFVPPVPMAEQKPPVENKIQTQPTNPKQQTNVTPPANSSNTELVDGINKLLVVVPADQKGKIAEELQKRGITVEPGKEAEAIAEFVQKNYPDKVEALKKGEMGAAMSIIQELQKQPAVVPQKNNEPQPVQPVSANNIVPVSDNMSKALSQAKSSGVNSSTVNGGAQEVDTLGGFPITPVSELSAQQINKKQSTVALR
jgi:hypothetical protein